LRREVKNPVTQCELNAKLLREAAGCEQKHSPVAAWKGGMRNKKVSDSRASCWFALAVHDAGIEVSQVM